uniref:CBM1 domain-containing protein n=1 Tax=Moniliophthora roreri TaxID=221103 RepID=A0A0W0FGY4_MONRR
MPLIRPALIVTLGYSRLLQRQTLNPGASVVVKDGGSHLLRTGETTCAAGAPCTEMNPYYSQCIPENNGPGPSSATGAPTGAPTSEPSAPAGAPSSAPSSPSSEPSAPSTGAPGSEPTVGPSDPTSVPSDPTALPSGSVNVSGSGSVTSQLRLPYDGGEPARLVDVFRHATVST